MSHIPADRAFSNRMENGEAVVRGGPQGSEIYWRKSELAVSGVGGGARCGMLPAGRASGGHVFQFLLARAGVDTHVCMRSGNGGPYVVATLQACRETSDLSCSGVALPPRTVHGSDREVGFALYATKTVFRLAAR